MTDIQCPAITKQGTRCPNRIMTGKHYCFTHEHSIADRRRQGSSRGGRNKATERRVLKRIPSDIRSTLDVLFTTLHGLSDGTVEVSQANAIANVSRAICAAWETGMVEAKLKELEGRLTATSTESSGRDHAA